MPRVLRATTRHVLLGCRRAEGQAAPGPTAAAAATAAAALISFEGRPTCNIHFLRCRPGSVKTVFHIAASHSTTSFASLTTLPLSSTPIQSASNCPRGTVRRALSKQQLQLRATAAKPPPPDSPAPASTHHSPATTATPSRHAGVQPRRRAAARHAGAVVCRGRRRRRVSSSARRADHHAAKRQGAGAAGGRRGVCDAGRVGAPQRLLGGVAAPARRVARRRGPRKGRVQ